MSLKQKHLKAVEDSSLIESSYEIMIDKIKNISDTSFSPSCRANKTNVNK